MTATLSTKIFVSYQFRAFNRVEILLPHRAMDIHQSPAKASIVRSISRAFATQGVLIPTTAARQKAINKTDIYRFTVAGKVVPSKSTAKSARIPVTFMLVFLL
jgi:hypothetical protein